MKYLIDATEGVGDPISVEYWVHRDNVDEIDFYGTYTLKKQINHIPTLLETKRAFLKTPNEIKEYIASSIIKTVYGASNALSVLMANGTTSELQKMHKIIKQKNIKYEEIKRLKSKKNDKETEPMNDKINDSKNNKPNKISSLSQISSDSITNICGYLDRRNIKSFKLTSFQNGMVCLREMNKSNIAIFNMNEIIDDKNNEYMDKLGLLIESNYSYCRYPANMKFSSLQQIWSEKYNVPISKQSFLIDFSFKKFRSLYPETIMNTKFDDKPIRRIPSSKFILFDIRNVIGIDGKTNK